MSPNETEYKSPIGRKIIAIFALIAGGIFVIAGMSHPAFFFGAITFIFPAVWWFLHERKVKADPTAPRMKRHWGIIATISALAFIACLIFTPPVEEDDNSRVGFVPEAPASSSTTSTATSTTSATTSPSVEKTTAYVRETTPDEPTRASVPAPQQTQQTSVERVAEAPVEIGRCGDVSIHEVGTTFYSDGTTGWTQECADEMNAQIPAQQPVPAPAPEAYGSCADARAAGASPLYAGQPGYSLDLDRDGDGVACE